jgi:hypothetical protein
MEHTVTMGDVKIKINIDRSVTFYISSKVKDICINVLNKGLGKIKSLLDKIKLR